MVNLKEQGVEQGLVSGIGRKAKEIKGNEKGSVIFADFVRSSNDNDDLQVRATQGIFKATGLPEKPLMGIVRMICRTYSRMVLLSNHQRKRK